ncbi:MAG: DNA-binding protein [candidate division GAL15 bacterium]
MTNRTTARAYVEQAGVILEEAKSLRERGAWNLVVRRCQESVELSLKGALRAVGVEVPKVHDVGLTVQEHAGRFPAHLRGQVSRMVLISRRLGRERELAFYGDEDAGTPPQALYREQDAELALQDAQQAFRWAQAVLEGA